MDSADKNNQAGEENEEGGKRSDYYHIKGSWDLKFNAWDVVVYAGIIITVRLFLKNYKT